MIRKTSRGFYSSSIYVVKLYSCNSFHPHPEQCASFVLSLFRFFHFNIVFPSFFLISHNPGDTFKWSWEPRNAISFPWHVVMSNFERQLILLEDEEAHVFRFGSENTCYSLISPLILCFRVWIVVSSFSMGLLLDIHIPISWCFMRNLRILSIIFFVCIRSIYFILLLIYKSISLSACE